MRVPARILAVVAALMLWSVPAGAQYMRLTTDNPADNTRLRIGVTNMVTITLDTNHDRDGSLQTCNSHSAATCGAVVAAQPLNMFSYTLAFKAVGGTVQWGTFTAADANYSTVSPQIQDNVEVEVNQARPTGSVTDPGLSTLGTIPVMILSGTPRIDIQVGAGNLNPFGFGTGFGTFCDGNAFPNTYVHGDPSDPCGVTNGVPGDWFDFDGAGAPNRAPTLNPIANMTVCGGDTADQAISGGDPDGDPLTFTAVSGPTYMTVTTNSPTTGNIHLAPGVSQPIGTSGASVRASDPSGAAADGSFTITIPACDHPPVLHQPADMTVSEGQTADQVLVATDADGNPLTFSKVAGPTFMTVTTTSPGTGTATGNVHLAPGFFDAGTSTGTVQVSDGLFTGTKSLSITVNDVNRPPVLNQPADMTVAEGSVANQTLSAADPDGNAVTFSKVSGPTYVTVTTTNATMGNVNVAPGFADAGIAAVTVRATDNGAPPLSNDKSFSVTVNRVCRTPILNQPANMTAVEGATADQVITGASADGSPVAFSEVAGPTFMTVTTTDATTGNIHIAPGLSDAGTYTATVRGTVGGICPGTNDKSFIIIVCSGGPPPTLAQPANMTVNEGFTEDQSLLATDPDGDPLSFTKAAGPSFMTVTTTSPAPAPPRET